MPYFIDGHNLISHTPGLSLDMLDDEIALIEILESLFKNNQKKAVIFFDKAFPGSTTTINRGRLQVRFIRSPLTADDAILRDLENLGGEAKNITVVTSDHPLSNKARQIGSRVISCENFLLLLKNKNSSKYSSPHLINDVDYWLQIFQDNS